MARIHLRIISEAEREQFLSEKPSTGGNVTIVTLTSEGGFVAENLPVYDLKGF